MNFVCGEQLRLVHSWLAQPHDVAKVLYPHQWKEECVMSSVSNSNRVSLHVIVLCGSAVLSNITLAVRYARGGTSSDVARDECLPILVTGGVGHSTRYLVEAFVCARYAAARDAHLPRWQEFLDQYFDLENTKDEEMQLQKLLSLDRSEADWIADAIQFCFDFPRELIWRERLSTNCGDNASKTVDLVSRSWCSPVAADDDDDAMLCIRRYLDKCSGTNRCGKQFDVHALLIQDPTMMRRSVLSFLRHVEDAKHIRWLLSCASLPELPRWTDESKDVEEILSHWCRSELCYGTPRYTSLIVGEHERLGNDANGYGPQGKGFIAACEMPRNVDDAFHVVKRSLNISRR